MLLEGTKVLPGKDIVAACIPEAKMEKHDGQCIQVSESGDRAIHFVNQRLIVGGDKEAVLEFLKKMGKQRAKSPAFAEAIACVGKNDVAFWGRMDRFPDAAEWFVKQGIRSVMGTVAFDKEISAEVRVHCTDTQSARRIGRGIHAGSNAIRGQLLLVSALPALGEFLPDGEDFKKFRHLPHKLIHGVEKALQHGTLKIDDTTVIGNVSLAMDGKTLCSEIERCMRLMGGQDGLGIELPFGALGEAMKSQPTPAPAPAPDPLSANPPAPPFPAALPPPLPIAPSQGITTRVGSPAIQQVAAPAPAVVAPAPGIVEPGSVKMTVANVRKEAAMLFEMAEDGKMTFIQKVSAGEAVDVKAASGKRLVAIFADKQAGESFAVPGSGGVWLLR
jgi:hypothetical protein